ncbi:MAG: sugar ABC transporter substrate-binding protein, partial [Clostridiales bacterium]|nr:sugar ABC transporter substrate-binding protein [Clostridiales bacterium]
LAVLLLVAGAATAAEAPVTLKYTMWDVSLKELEETQIIGPFEAANPDIKIDFQPIPWDEYWKKVQVTIAADDPYDVFYMSVAYVWEFAHKGMTMDLEPLYEKVVAERGVDYLYPKMLDILRYPNASGHLYEIPYAWVGSLLFYNKTMFDEAGLSYPNDEWTFDDMWAAAEQLTSGEGPGKKYGFHVTNGSDFVDAYINAAGGYVLNDDMNKCLINEPEAVAALEELYGKIQSGISPSPAALQGQPNPFLSGKVAMAIAGSYNIDTYRTIKDFDWDVAMVPTNAQTGKRVVYGGLDGLSLASNCKHPDEAMRFLMYYCVDGRDVSSYMGGKVSIVQELAQDESWLEKDLVPSDKGALLRSAPFIKGADFCYKWVEWRGSIVANELADAFNGNVPMQDACDSIAAQVDKILAEVS